MQNENIATCKSTTWNSTTYERLLDEKSGTWNWCSIKKLWHEKNAKWKKVQQEKYKLPQWNKEKVHKNSALECTNG